MKWVFVLAVGCAACGQPQQSQQAPLAVREQRQAVLNGIADKCGLSRSTFKLVANDELQMQPSPDARYESVDCALTELKKNKLVRSLPMGFVGNEYVPENRQ